jgi:cytochrome c peroxidase
MKWITVALLVSVYLLQGCSPDTSPSSTTDLKTIPYQPLAYPLEEAAEFVKMQIPDGSPLTVEGVELGRMLFYDPILSGDSTMSCASCHMQSIGFTDGRPVSTGIRNLEGSRSAPALINMGYHYAGLFWDGRVNTLEGQAIMPVEDSLELNHNWDSVEIQIQRHKSYPIHFRKAFGIEKRNEISRDLITKAIAQFERSLISNSSKYDKVVRGEMEFTAAEKRGWTIFFDASDELPKAECGHCHIDPLFTNLQFENNGIESVKDLDDFEDKGRGAISGNYYDNGKFKTPTLRNIALTAPYMHDGRFATLDDVLDHYISGGHPAVNASPNVRKLDLDESHKKDLIAFLHTLTDSTLLNDTAFSNPFAE